VSKIKRRLIEWFSRKTSFEKTSDLSVTRFKSVFHSVSDLIVVVDKKNGTILDLNNRWSQILDGSPKHLVGKKIFDIGVFDNREELIKVLKLALHEGAANNVELLMTSGAGERFIGLANFKLIHYGSRSEIIINIHDISESKLIERLLSFVASMPWLNLKDKAIPKLLMFVAQQIGSHHMVVSKIDSARSKAQSIAFIKFGKIVDNISYDLKGAPCQDVFNGEVCLINERLQQRFPLDKGLIGMQAESYVGVPILDSQQKHIGIVAAIHTKSFKNPNLVAKILQIAAKSIANELDRFQFVEFQQIQEEKYRQLFENLSSGMALHEAIYDQDGNIIDFKVLDVNLAYQTLLGKKKDQIIGKSIIEIWPKANKYWIDFFSEVIRDRETKHFDGFSDLWGRYFSGSAFSPAPNQFAIIFQDVTKERLNEQALRERELHLNTIFDNTPSALLLVDENAEIVRMNPAGYQLANNSEFIQRQGQQIGNVLKCINSFSSSKGCGFTAACQKCTLRHLLKDTFGNAHCKMPTEMLFRQAGNPNPRENYFIASSALVAIKGKRHALITLEDITSQKLLELDLVESRNRALESDRLKTAFFNNLSHEIRTPLNGIVGFSNLLRKEEISKKEIDIYVSYINDNSNRLLQCMNNVIELSNIISGNYTPSYGFVDLNVIMDKSLKYCKELYPQRIQLVRWETKGMTQFDADCMSIQGVVNQIVVNSLKFTLEGAIQIRWYVSKTRLSCIVADTGVGIDPKNYASIFTPFKQVEDGMIRSYGGVGLWLAIVKGYLDLLGGTIVVKSEVGRGSLFRFTIPIFEKSIS